MCQMRKDTALNPRGNDGSCGGNHARKGYRGRAKAEETRRRFRPNRGGIYRIESDEYRNQKQADARLSVVAWLSSSFGD